MGIEEFNSWVLRTNRAAYLYLPGESFAFCYIPKCGTTSAFSYLQQLRNLRLVKNGKEVANSKVHDNFFVCTELPAGVKTIALVRSPYRRVVSGFLTRAQFVNERASPGFQLYEPGSKDLADFKFFLSRIAARGRDVDVHFATQLDLIGGTEPDYVVNIEEADAKDRLYRLLTRLGAPLEIEFPHLHAAEAAPALWLAVLNEAMVKTAEDTALKALEVIYAEDFNHFHCFSKINPSKDDNTNVGS